VPGERLELLQQMRELADTLAVTAGRLAETVTTTSDPGAAEAEVTAMRAAAEQRMWCGARSDVTHSSRMPGPYFS